MDSSLKFDYYHGIESEQFSFYRVPRLLIKDERFKELSSDAKLLYGLMLDRMALSMKHGWFDDEDRAYIHYTMENIMEDLGCAKEKCAKVLAELDSKKGIGLIEKKRQGLGRPDIIYVKNFATLQPEKGQDNGSEDPSDTDVSIVPPEVRRPNFKKFENRTSGGSEIELQEVRISNFKKFENRTSRGSETELAEVRESNPNYNNIKYTDKSHTDSIHPIHPIESIDSIDQIGRWGQRQEMEGRSERDDDMIDGIDDARTYMKIIRENIEYDHHMRYGQWQDKALFEELYEVICEIVCVERKTVKVNGEEYPYGLVRSRFLKLNGSHLEYVIDCMRDTTTKITNIRAYMVTALYNAPNTMNHYYQQEVQHDLYGSG